MVWITRKVTSDKSTGGIYMSRVVGEHTSTTPSPATADMICKVFLLVTALAVVCHAGVLVPATPVVATPVHVPHVVATPVHAAPVATRVEEYDPHPQYAFSYNVEDSQTGDSKSQHETRNGDVVQGSYSLAEPDGSRRTVEYTADPHNGFNAIVHREAGAHPVNQPTTPAPVYQPVYRQPVAPAPVVVARPVYQPVAPVTVTRPVPQYTAARQPSSGYYRSSGAPYSSSY